MMKGIIPERHVALGATYSGDGPGSNSGRMARFTLHIWKEMDMEPFMNTRSGAWALLVTLRTY